MKKIVAAVLLIFSMTTWAWCQHRDAQVDRVQTASTILSQIMSAPDRAIPDGILSGAKCIAIVPSMLKASFVFGANYGKGVATCRTEHGWSAPVFFKVTGGSFGFQAGGQASDLVLIIRTDEGMQHLLQSKFKLGADASAAAGPVGRDAQASTDLTLRAQVLTYSRSRGLFLGVSLSGGVIRQDDGDTRAFYGGKDWTFYSLLRGEVAAPQDSLVLLNTVEKYAPTPKVRAQAAPAPVVTSPGPAATPAETPATSSPADPAQAPAATSDSTTDEPAAAPSAATPSSTPAPRVAATPANSGTVNP
ncbi:MAG: lipid-binding SYLF domain-containing protein [Terriglobales bacterium]